MIGKKILVVEDDCLLAQTVEMCLMKRGYQVRVLHDGAAAVEYLFEERPDLVVLDIRLPDCDGWFITDILKKLESAEKVQIVVVSALEPDRNRVAEVKPYAYVQKPFDMGQLMQIVDRSLRAGGKTNQPVAYPVNRESDMGGEGR